MCSDSPSRAGVFEVRRRAQRGAAMLVLATTFATQARAQTLPSDPAERARASYGNGTRAFAEHRYADAAKQFEDAARRVPSPVALFTAAIAWERADEPARAADDYTRALSLGGLDAKQLQKARERLDALEATLGTVRVVGATGTVVQIDDLGPALTVPATLHALPGAHVLLVRSPVSSSRSPAVTVRCAILLSAGQKVSHDLVREKAALERGELGTVLEGGPEKGDGRGAASTGIAQAGTASGGTGGRSSPWVSVGYVLLGAGAAMELAAAFTWWGPAMATRDDYRDDLIRGDLDHAARTKDHAMRLQTVTNVALIGGAVLVGAGVASVLVGRTPAGKAPATSARPVLGVQLGLAGAALTGEW